MLYTRKFIDEDDVTLCTPDYSTEALINGQISCTDTNNDGSVCTFTCDPQYLLDGNATATCDSTKGWNSQMPKCDGEKQQLIEMILYIHFCTALQTF